MSVSKLRTYSVISTASFAGSWYNPRQIFHKDPKVFGGNLQKLSDGVNQKKHVLPQDPTLTSNKKHIGFFNAGVHDSAVNNVWLAIKPEYLTRTVKIYMPDTNHMHNVPVLPGGYKWCVQFERMAVYKSQIMGWTYTNDTNSRRLISFKKLEDAIVYCRSMGLAYEISYPHFRYHTKKNYGDNFKWKGSPRVGEEDFQREYFL